MITINFFNKEIKLIFTIFSIKRERCSLKQKTMSKVLHESIFCIILLIVSKKGKASSLLNLMPFSPTPKEVQMETLFFSLLPPLVGGILTRQFFRDWRAWAGLALAVGVGAFGCWHFCGMSTSHALWSAGGAGFVGAIGREIFQGLAGWVRAFLRRSTGWLIAVGGMTGLWFTRPDVVMGLLQLAVPILVLVWWARSLLFPKKKK